MDVIKYDFGGNKTSILVSKRWENLVSGEEGFNQWKAQSKIEVERKISVAKDAALDESLSWMARICVMAIANDAFALENAFRNVDDTSCGVGAALKEQRAKDDVKYVDEDDESDCSFHPFIDPDFMPVPRGHPFFHLCRCMPGNDIYEEHDQLWSFTSSIAHAAAMVRSVEALQLLGSLNDFPLWKMNIFPLVKTALANPTLDCVVRSISELLSNQTIAGNDINRLHMRHYGCNGNHLHLAAGRGHIQLTKALIKGGMNPKRRCERIGTCKRNVYGGYYDSDSDSDDSDDVIADERDRGVKQYPLP